MPYTASYERAIQGKPELVLSVPLPYDLMSELSQARALSTA